MRLEKSVKHVAKYITQNSEVILKKVSKLKNTQVFADSMTMENTFHEIKETSQISEVRNYDTPNYRLE